MSIIKIHGAAMSTCTQRVLATFREKAVPFQLITVDIVNGEHKKPPHLAHQPFGQIPYIDDDGFVLFESRAIARYISKKFQGQGTDLFPADLKKGAVVEQWLSVEEADFNSHGALLAYEKIVKARFGLGPADEEKCTGYVGKLSATLDVYEKHFASTGNSYLAGDEFTLADLSHLPVAVRIFQAGHGDLITSRKLVGAWYTRISERESWKTTAAAAAPPPR
ncbi:hypothetical protein HKX48_004400 [Thoreauomyces humboldtii]|nr:hypothetical protein HKX48_004400 [Thoreauomyces humboldtii]